MGKNDIVLQPVPKFIAFDIVTHLKRHIVQNVKMQ